MHPQVRFATRLGFHMSSELLEAAADPEVQEALQDKVSRERVGNEFDLMMVSRSSAPSYAILDPLNAKGPTTGPVAAVSLLKRLGVAPIVLMEPARETVTEWHWGSPQPGLVPPALAPFLSTSRSPALSDSL